MLACTPACRESCQPDVCGWRCCALFFPKHPRRRRDEAKLELPPGATSATVTVKAGATCKPAPWSEAAPKSTSSPVRMALAIAGGLRHWQRCARNLATEEALIQAGPAVGIFLASWYDREFECVLGLEGTPSRDAAERAVRKSFADAKLALSGLWVGEFSQLDYSMIGRNAALHDETLWHVHVYSQYALWERALAMVGPEYDVVVKTRPDAYLYTYLTALSWSRCALTGLPMMSLLGQPLVVRNSSVFAFVSPYVDGAIDDTFLVGSAPAMQLAVGGLKRSIDLGEYQLSDSQYWSRARSEAWPTLHAPAARRRADGVPTAWRSPSAESFFLQHVLHRNLSVYCLGGRALLMNVETCSRCLLPNGTGMRFGHWSRIANLSWARPDWVTPLLGPPQRRRRAGRRSRVLDLRCVRVHASEGACR